MKQHIQKCGRVVRFALGFAVAGLTANGVMPTAALAEQGGAHETATLFALEVRGVEDWFSSPKDAGLVRALKMLPARIDELREQVPDLQEVPQPALDLVYAALKYPMRFAVTNSGFDPDTGAPGLGVVISFDMGANGEAAAEQMHEDIGSMLAFAPMDLEVGASPRFDGMDRLQLPFGGLDYGPRQVVGRWFFEVIYGAVDDPHAGFASLPTPERGATAPIRATLDLAAVSPFSQMLLGMAMMFVPDGAGLMEEIKQSGLVGPDAVRVTYMEGFADGRAYARSRVDDLGKFAEHWGMSREPIARDDLRVIPADATCASLKRTNFQHTWDNLTQYAQQAKPAEFDEAMAVIRDEIGIEIASDVIEPLGTLSGFYFADSTGGGSLASGVGLVSLADPERMSRTLGTLSERFNESAKERLPEGVSIRIHSFARGGTRYFQLRFPGLPVPIEPTIAIAGTWLVIGATPHGAIAAADQITSGRKGIEANPRFAGAIGDTPSIATVFIDFEQTIRDGYPILMFASSMLSNAVRSPLGAEREPGLVLPLYAQLVDECKPMVVRSWWDDEDLVSEMETDSSWLVNAAGILGAGRDAVPLVVGALIGGGIGAKIAEENFNDWDSGEFDFEATPEEDEPAASEDAPY